MTIELPAAVEKELRDLAVTQSRDIGDLVEEAVRQYLEATAITDLSAAEVAETQARLVGELHGIDEWKDGLDNILTVPRSRLKRLMGSCDAPKIVELNQAVKTALDIR